MYTFLVFLTSCIDKNKKYTLTLWGYLILTAMARVNLLGQSITISYLLGLFIFAAFRRPHKQKLGGGTLKSLRPFLLRVFLTDCTAYKVHILVGAVLPLFL